MPSAIEWPLNRTTTKHYQLRDRRVQEFLKSGAATGLASASPASSVTKASAPKPVNYWHRSTLVHRRPRHAGPQRRHRFESPDSRRSGRAVFDKSQG